MRRRWWLLLGLLILCVSGVAVYFSIRTDSAREPADRPADPPAERDNPPEAGKSEFRHTPRIKGSTGNPPAVVTHSTPVAKSVTTVELPGLVGQQ